MCLSSLLGNTIEDVYLLPFQGVTKEDLERAEKTLKEATIESRLSSVIDDKSDKENKPESDSTSSRRRNYFDDVSLLDSTKIVVVVICLD